MRPPPLDGLRLPACVASLGAAVWLAMAPATYAQRPDDAATPHDAAHDAALDARVDAGVRCVPIDDDDEEEAPPAPPPGDAGADAARPSAGLLDAPAARAPRGMVVIPGGVFRYGGAWASVGPFAIDRREVTAAAYARCVTAGECPAAPDPYGQMATRATAPAVNVSWEMARRYCAWAGARLPTEAEWELAARGIAGRRYPWGERAPDCSLARHAGCGDAPLRVGALPAGQSEFGLFDMAGNAAEWVADVFGPRAPRDDERVAVNPTGPATGAQRVVRGGSFLSTASALGGDARRGVDAREMRGDLGFRCARGL